nr:transposase [Streptomyces sp. S1D4-11]
MAGEHQAANCAWAGHPAGRPRSSRTKAHSSRGLRSFLRRRGIAHTILEETDRHRHNRSRQGGWPPMFGWEAYRRRNIIESCFNRLKGFPSITTRYDKTAASYEAAVTLASFLGRSV